MFCLEFLINLLKQNENCLLLFNYFPFISDWFLAFCILFLLFIFVFYSYNVIFLLKSIIGVLFINLFLLFFMYYFLHEGYFNFENINGLFIINDVVYFNSLCISSELLLLKILVIFISLLFFLIRFLYLYSYPSLKKEGLSDVSCDNSFSLNNASILNVFVLMFSVLSILFIISSNNFLLSYLCLELFSLCSMILIGSSSKMFDIINMFPLKSRFVNNNLLWSLNYLLVSALGSSIFLLGVSYLYGHTGSINFFEIKLFFLNLTPIFLFYDFENFSLFFSLFLIFLGLLIKGGFAPFHFWIFELYKYLPYYLLTYFLLFSKVIVILFLFKLSLFTNGFVFYLFVFFGLLNVFLGTFYLIKQKTIKYILIGSSVNNSGYLLLSIAFNNFFSFYVFYVFLFAYLITNLGVLIILSAQSVLFRRAKFFINLNSISSLKFFTFFNKCSLMFFVMSLMGLPFFMGFWAKSLLLLFYSEFDLFFLSYFSSYVLNFLVIFFLVLNLISFLYYLTLISYLFFDQTDFSLNYSVMAKIYRFKVRCFLDFLNFLLISFLLFLNFFLTFLLLAL